MSEFLNPTEKVVGRLELTGSVRPETWQRLVRQALDLGLKPSFYSPAEGYLASPAELLDPGKCLVGEQDFRDYSKTYRGDDSVGSGVAVWNMLLKAKNLERDKGLECGGLVFVSPLEGAEYPKTGKKERLARLDLLSSFLTLEELGLYESKLSATTPLVAFFMNERSGRSIGPGTRKFLRLFVDDTARKCLESSESASDS